MPKGKSTQGRIHMGFGAMLEALFEMGSPGYRAGDELKDQWEGGMNLVAQATSSHTIMLSTLLQSFPELTKLEATVPAVVLQGIRKAMALFRFIEDHAADWGATIQYGEADSAVMAHKRNPTKSEIAESKRRTNRLTRRSKSKARQGSIASQIIDFVGGEKLARSTLQSMYDKFGSVPALAGHFQRKGIKVKVPNLSYILKGLGVKTSRTRKRGG